MNITQVIVFGDKTKCSICKGAYAYMEREFSGSLGDIGVSYQFLDQTADAKGYAAGKRFVGVASVPKYPCAYVIGDGTQVVGSFLVRNMTAAAAVKKVKSLCASCGETPPVKTKTCPTCGGKGKVVALVALLLTLASGCVWTSGAFKVPPTPELPNPPTVTVHRFAVLYPFEVADVTYKAGEFRMGSYKTDGGAAGVCQVIDSTGKVVGAFVGTAAKAAVATP